MCMSKRRARQRTAFDPAYSSACLLLREVGDPKKCAVRTLHDNEIGAFVDTLGELAVAA